MVASLVPFVQIPACGSRRSQLADHADPSLRITQIPGISCASVPIVPTNPVIQVIPIIYIIPLHPSQHQVTDRGLRALAQGCSQLSALNLWVCSGVSNDGVCELAATCPEISCNGQRAPTRFNAPL